VVLCVLKEKSINTEIIGVLGIESFFSLTITHGKHKLGHWNFSEYVFVDKKKYFVSYNSILIRILDTDTNKFSVIQMNVSSN